MIENLTRSDLYLYHYTTASTANDNILMDRTIRMGRYTATNDPKEVKSWEFTVGANGDLDLGKYTMAAESAWLSGELKSRARIACFCQDSNSLTGNHLNDIFQRGYCKPRMWAQYAGNHTGMCLVFDKVKLDRLIKAQIPDGRVVMSGPIAYVNRGIVPDLLRDQAYMINADFLEEFGRDIYAECHLRTHYQTLFFEKMEDWANESEWRWVVFADTEDGDVFIEYKDALVGVVFGNNADKGDIRTAMRLCKPHGARCVGLKWKNCSPWYDFGNPLYLPKPWGELD